MTTNDDTPGVTPPERHVTRRERYRGAMLGLACGDALGTCVTGLHWAPDGSHREMTGGGPFRLKPGYWTDDTALALCLADSLLERGWDLRDQIARHARWYTDGYRSSIGHAFDVGGTIRIAVLRFLAGEVDTAVPAPAAGNGCLMRLAPVPLWLHREASPARDAELDRRLAESSRITHGSPECVDATRLFGAMITRALDGLPKEELLTIDPWPHAPLTGTVDAIRRGSFRTREPRHADGWVIDSLDAALWAFATTSSLEEALVAVVNLGGDADSTGAICGQLAGAYYGDRTIPERWLAVLHDRDGIAALGERLMGDG